MSAINKNIIKTKRQNLMILNQEKNGVTPSHVTANCYIYNNVRAYLIYKESVESCRMASGESAEIANENLRKINTKMFAYFKNSFYLCSANKKIKKIKVWKRK